jgi:thioredoxin 1
MAYKAKKGHFVFIDPGEGALYLSGNGCCTGGHQMSKDLIHVTDSDFEQEILKSEKPALVDFWAPWCGPCQRIAPIIEELATEYKDKVKVAKINVDESRKVATDLGVMSIPTLMLFKGGKVIDKVIGLVPKDRLKEIVNKAL